MEEVQDDGELGAWEILCDGIEYGGLSFAYDVEPGESEFAPPGKDGLSREDSRLIVQFIVDACNEKEQREA